MQMIRVMTKGVTRGGIKYAPTPTEYLVSFERVGKKITSITIFKEVNGLVMPGRKFELGDMAEYDSYNLSYYAGIEKITENGVTIAKHHDARVHRLNIYKFCWRNYDFDLARVRQENHEMSNYI